MKKVIVTQQSVDECLRADSLVPANTGRPRSIYLVIVVLITSMQRLNLTLEKQKI